MAGVEDMLNEARKSLGLGEPNHIQRWYAGRNGSAFNYNFAWCNAAVTYWAYQSGNHSVVCHGTDFAYTPWHANKFFDEGEWYPGTSANVRNAKPGDIVFFDWGGSNSRGRIDHVGVVERNNGNGTLTTIEGNTSNRCMRRTRNASTIAGYGRPKYSGASADPSDATPGYWSFEWEGQPLHVPEDTAWLELGVYDSMQVKRLQNTMNLVFDENLLVDGDFGPATEAAVKRMQADLGVSVDGVYGPMTAGALFDHIKAALDTEEPAPEPEPEPQPEPEPEPQPEPDGDRWGEYDIEWHYYNATITRPLTIPKGNLKPGDSGDRVRNLQMALNFVGAGWQVHASGEYGKCTEDAVKSFQKVSVDFEGKPLEVDGIYWGETAKALNRRVLEATPEPSEPDPEPDPEPEPEPDPTPTGPWGDRQVVFQDTFDGSSVDRSKWVVNRSWSYPNGGPDNPNDAKLDHFDDGAISVSDGVLTFTATPRSDGKWNTGLITTGNAWPESDTFALLPGDFHVVHCQLPEASPVGAWPALWTWNNGGSEIDSFEYHNNNPNLLELTNHVNGGGFYYRNDQLIKPGKWLWIGTDFQAGNCRYYAGETLDDMQLLFEDNSGVGSNWRAFCIINLSLSDGTWHPAASGNDPIYFRVSEYRVYR